MSDEKISQNNKSEQLPIELIIKNFQQKNTTKLTIMYYKDQIYVKDDNLYENRDYHFVSIRMIKHLFKVLEFDQITLIGFEYIPKWLQYIISHFRGKLCNLRPKNLKVVLSSIVLMRELEFIVNGLMELENLEELLGYVINEKIIRLIIILRRDTHLIAKNIMSFEEFLNIKVSQHQLDAFNIYEITKIE